MTIEWPSYNDGALPKGEVARKIMTASGDTIVISKEGKTYNCHPIQYGYGWNPEKAEPAFVFEEGCYPIRWELASYEVKELGL